MKELKLVQVKAKKDGLLHIYEIGEYTVREHTDVCEIGTVIKYYSVMETNHGANKYIADIYYDCKWGEEKGAFQIQTTAYGALDMDEFAKFMKAQQDAMEVVEILTNTFLK